MDVSRGNHCAVAIANESYIFVYGGYHYDNGLKKAAYGTVMYNIEDQAWTSINKTGPCRVVPEFQTQCGVFQDRLIVIPSLDEHNRSCTALFNWSRQTWFTLQKDIRPAKANGFVVKSHEKLYYVIGNEIFHFQDELQGWRLLGGRAQALPISVFQENATMFDVGLNFCNPSSMKRFTHYKNHVHM